MGKNQNQVAQGAQTETANVEAMEQTANVEAMEQTPTEPAPTETMEQSKAAKILRARLPLLSECGLNFERRTGAFFRATLVNELDKDGNDVIDPATGTVVQRVRRLVVDLDHESEAKTVEACTAEIEAKRAARIVEEKNNIELAFDKRAQVIADALAELNLERGAFNEALEYSLSVVEAFVVPEKPKAQRVAVSAKLNNVLSENEKLRALLIAAGIDPDAQN